MKREFYIVICFLFLTSYSVFAQRKSPRSAYDTNPASAYDSKPEKPAVSAATKTGAKGAVTATGKTDKKAPAENNLPVEVIDDTQEGGLFGAGKPSLRKDNVLEDDMYDSTAKPLPYTTLYASDALFRVRVWRVIDARNQKNAPYFYNKAIESDANTRLINVLLQAMKNDSVQAFSGVDDRFTTPISFDEALRGFGGGRDTSAKYDLDGNVSGYQVRSRMVTPDSIYKFRLKEEWIFNKRDGKTYVRILGIAPVTSFTTSDGYTMENSEHAVFWLYYPDIRKAMVRTNITNPMNMGGSITWEEVFENRLFESQIIKSSLDAENGFTNYPLTAAQAGETEHQLRSLSRRMWAKQ